MRAALYVRVSTEEQVKHGFSLDEQRRTLAAHAGRQGWEVVEVVEDPGDSGADPNRLGLVRILELAEAGKIDLVLSWKRDRLFRDLYYRRNFEQDLAEYGVRTVSLNDTGSRIGDKILDVLSEEEREQIRDRTRAGKLGKARRGLMPGGNQVHYGFRFLGGKAEQYEVYPEKMTLVERIFRMVGVEGRSLSAVKLAFEGEGIPTPRGARWWNIATIKRIIDNDVYLTRTVDELRTLGVTEEVLARLDPERHHGVYWFGRVRMRRNYGQARTKFTIEHKDREEWVPIPVPDCGVPPEWVRAARERATKNIRWKPSTDPAIRLRGRIYCACGYAMTSLVTGSENRKKSGGKRRYYVCSQHRKRGPCPYNKFHRVLETEERVERFVLSLLENPDILREKVEEQAERERRALRNTDKEARRIRQRLAKLEIVEDGYSEQQAEGLISMDRLREKLATLREEHADLEGRLSGLAGGERRIAELEALPDLVEQYLRDLPSLVDRRHTVREYETAPAERTPDNPLGVRKLTPENFRHLPDEELAEKQRQATEERSQRFRELYGMLGLRVTCHPDLSLEVTWGTDCSKWLGRV